jgi:hypothetical protein
VREAGRRGLVRGSRPRPGRVLRVRRLVRGRGQRGRPECGTGAGPGWPTAAHRPRPPGRVAWPSHHRIACTRPIGADRRSVADRRQRAGARSSTPRPRWGFTPFISATRPGYRVVFTQGGAECQRSPVADGRASCSCRGSAGCRRWWRAARHASIRRDPARSDEGDPAEVDTDLHRPVRHEQFLDGRVQPVGALSHGRIR